MNTRDISEAKDPLLRASMAAMQRAAALARQTAIETKTGIVLFIDESYRLRDKLRAGQITKKGQLAA